MPTLPKQLQLALAALLLTSACSSGQSQATEDTTATSSVPVITIDDGNTIIAIPVLLTEAVDLVLDDPGARPVPLPNLPGPTSSDPTADPTQTGVAGSDTGPTTTVAAGTPPTTVQAATGQSTIKPEQMPLSMAAIRGGESVLLVDTNSGNSVTVRQLPVVVDETDQVGPQAPRSVDIDPVSQNIWYDECCRPAEGTSHAVDLVTDASIQTLSSGFPATDPQGAVVATTAGPLLTLKVLDSGVVTSFDLTQLGENTNGTRSGWSIDGLSLAVEVSVGDQPQVALFTIDRTDGLSIVLDKLFQPPAAKRWASPTFGADGLLRVVESAESHILRTIDPATGSIEKSATIPVPGIIDIDVDASGTWWLIVDGAGHAHAFDESSLVTLPGDGYSAAAW